MRYFWVIFLASLGLFAQNPLDIVVTNGSQVIIPIEASDRGEDIKKIFDILSSPPYKKATSEIGIQTEFNIFIPNVQFIEPAKNGTILIIRYFTVPQVQKFVILPVEQITELVYSETFIPNGASFEPVSVSGISPFFLVDSKERSEDIQDVVSILNSKKPYKTNTSKVALQTTLTGPFYVPITDGLIPNIQSITLASDSKGTLFIVTYRVNFRNATIIVAPEQVVSIEYFP